MQMTQNIFRIVSIIFLAILFAGCLQGPAVDQKHSATMQTIDQIHRGMSARDIPRLKAIIETSNNTQERESALRALGDITVSSNAKDDVVPFLKNIALNDEDSDVRMAAKMNLALIREQHPDKKFGNIDLKIDGPIREGQNITLIATISSSVTAEKALVSIRKITGDNGNLTDGITLAGVESLPVRIQLLAGTKKEIPIHLHINKPGNYTIFCTLQLDFSRIDYEIDEKTVDISMKNGVGTFRVLD